MMMTCLPSPSTCEATCVTCPSIVVRHADYANCNGVYNLLEETVVTWAPGRPVYKHKTKNR